LGALHGEASQTGRVSEREVSAETADGVEIILPGERRVVRTAGCRFRISPPAECVFQKNRDAGPRLTRRQTHNLNACSGAIQPRLAPAKIGCPLVAVDGRDGMRRGEAKKREGIVDLESAWLVLDAEIDIARKP